MAKRDWLAGLYPGHLSSCQVDRPGDDADRVGTSEIDNTDDAQVDSAGLVCCRG